MRTYVIPVKTLGCYAVGTATTILPFFDGVRLIGDGIPLRSRPMFPGQYAQHSVYKSIRNVGCSKRASD